MTSKNLLGLALFCCASTLRGQSAGAKQPQPASYDYEQARPHEIKPHRRTIPLKGIHEGFNQFHITLKVSSSGEVLSAEATGDQKLLKYWPEVEAEVLEWKYTPFEKEGKPVEAEVEEYVDLVPPERAPKVHLVPPPVRQDSRIEIMLGRSGCYGSCPAYTVTVGTSGIVFEGSAYVVAAGKHVDRIDPVEVRNLARRFVKADFYSMDDDYSASVTDCPGYTLSISIDGRKKSVYDYVGEWVGKPAVITELEDAVDEFARTDRWINGSEGMVEALQAEKFNLRSFDAQVMLKQAATRGVTATVRELIEAGVPLDPLPAPKRKGDEREPPFQNVSWLSAASSHRDTLAALIDAEASKDDQDDKDLALVGAARSGDVKAVRALIEYGADPNVDLAKKTIVENGAGMTMERQGAGSILHFAAESGNPEMVKAILSFHPDVNVRAYDGKTALFEAGEYRDKDVDGARAECVRLLLEAGADVNARDNRGNTPLHETFLGEVEMELLKHGADVNAQNDDGETPIFTTVDAEAIPLFVSYGADLTIRNNKGQTALEASEHRGKRIEAALREAMANAALKTQ